MMRNRSASWLLGALLLAAPAVGLLAEEEGDADTANQKAACEAAIKEDDARDEQKLTEAYRAKCKALTVEASRLKPVEATAGRDEEDKSKTAKGGEDFPPMQGNDLTPEQDEAVLERAKEIEKQTARDAKFEDWQRRWQDMTPEQRALEDKSLIAGARAERLGQLKTAEYNINASAQEARFANSAAAYPEYEKLAAKTDLTPEEKIQKQTLATMAGDYAGRMARESGHETETTKEALANDPTFADAFKNAEKEIPKDSGVGGYWGQHTMAEPRQLENHTRGECEKSNGNVPALPCGDITSGSGPRNLAFSPMHYGQDSRAARGAAVMGSAIGVVSAVRPEGPGRVSVHVDHGNNMVTVHRHIAADSALPVGSRVDTNTQIGAVETAGTGPHKHTEIWHNGVVLNTNNYNQAAYADLCNVGCKQAEVPTVVASEHILTSPNQVTRLDGSRENGANPTTQYAGGLRQNSGSYDGNNIRRDSQALYENGYITLAGGQRYTPGQGGMGDGGMYDTAPNFQGMRMPSGQQGGVSTANTPLNPYGGLFNPDLMKQLAVSTLTSQTTVPLGPTPEPPANTRLTPEQCQEKMNQGERALDLLRNHPECSLLTK